jgi:two-component system, cell cycle sensor histidine kinase and response regulator CckA
MSELVEETISIDATEQAHREAAIKAAGEQLRLAQRLEIVGRLAGALGHDFNNLLSVVLGYSDLLLVQLKPDDPIYESISEIRTAGKAITQLTHQLIEFSHEGVVRPMPLNINDVAKGMRPLLNRLIGVNVELELKTEPKLWNVLCDKRQLEKIIVNLVANANDAMPGGGKLTIETDNVDLDAATCLQSVHLVPGANVLLAVRDHGVGIATESQQRVSEPTFVSKGRSIGLGLSTVNEIVKQNGGGVLVESDPGLGTVFRVYLPRTDKQPQITTPTKLSRLEGTETVLLVEDEARVRSLAGKILKLYGYRVIEKANGSEALEFCRNHPEPFDLLLTDVEMPKTSGTALAKQLAELYPNVKILFMSGYFDEVELDLELGSKEVAFLQKPITPDLLLTKVREILDGAQY